MNRVSRPVFRAFVNADISLLMQPAVRAELDRHLASLRGKCVELTIDEQSRRRSDQANRYYWACVLTPVEEANVGYTKEEFHELMLAKFSTRKHYEIVNRTTGEVVEEYDLVDRSSTLTGQNFYRFVELVRQFLAEFYEIVTDDPDPDYWQKRKA